jgi:hypothetical protein
MLLAEVMAYEGQVRRITRGSERATERESIRNATRNDTRNHTRNHAAELCARCTRPKDTHVCIGYICMQGYTCMHRIHMYTKDTHVCIYMRAPPSFSHTHMYAYTCVRRKHTGVVPKHTQMWCPSTHWCGAQAHTGPLYRDLVNVLGH